jgi:DNA-binding MarR family transcriptional regulator
MKSIQLTEDYALVMQQIEEDGEEDFENLAETLRFDRGRLMNIISSLQHKGLLIVRYTQSGIWLKLSHKGKKLSGLIWPELPYIQY